MNIVTNNKWIGQRTIRPDGADKVTGRAAFAVLIDLMRACGCGLRRTLAQIIPGIVESAA